jgi:hypothetical protein
MQTKEKYNPLAAIGWLSLAEWSINLVPTKTITPRDDLETNMQHHNNQSRLHVGLPT